MSSYQFNLASFFRDIAKKNAQNIAFKYPSQSYTYKQVYSDVCTTAKALHNQGLRQGDVVVLFNNKDYDFYIAMLACLSLGVVYTNIDPNVNLSWLDSILDICKPKLALGVSEREEYSHCLRQKHCSFTCVAQLRAKPSEKALFEIEVDINGQRIAYIMFTSGSTGRPKGVAVTHQNVIHFIHWGQKRCSVKNSDVFTCVNPMYFDNSVFDFYISLFSGASLAPIKQEIVVKPLQLVKTIDKLECTILFSVPSLLIYLLKMRVLSKSVFQSLRMVIFGGESFAKTELKKLYDLYADRVVLINVYGPTECTCICSSYEITKKDFEDMSSIAPLGAMNDNVSAIIFDDEGRISDSGELCLLGPNIAHGYYNDEAKTKQSFVSYSGLGYYRASLYKTGDLVQKKGDVFLFLGRQDNQIKRMGYRIELESIEQALNMIEDVFESAVFSVVNPYSSMNHIIAYVASSNSRLTPQIIEQEAGKRLPKYMLPNKYVVTQLLPKNPNGKIDKKALKKSEELLFVN